MEDNIPKKNCPITAYFSMDSINIVNKTELNKYRNIYKLENIIKFNSYSNLLELKEREEKIIELKTNNFIFTDDILRKMNHFEYSSNKTIFVEYFNKIFKPVGYLKHEMEKHGFYLTKSSTRCLQIRSGLIEYDHPNKWTDKCIEEALDNFLFNSATERRSMTYISVDSSLVVNYIKLRKFSNIYILDGENLHYRSPKASCLNILKTYLEFMLFEFCQEAAVTKQSTFGVYSILRSEAAKRKKAKELYCSLDGLRLGNLSDSVLID